MGAPQTSGVVSAVLACIGTDIDKFDLCGTKVKAIERSEIPPRLCWRETHRRALDCFPHPWCSSTLKRGAIRVLGYVISASERHASQLMSMKQYAALALNAVSCRNPSISDERIGRMVDRRCRSSLHNEHYQPESSVLSNISVIAENHDGFILLTPISLTILYLFGCNHASTFPTSHTEASICRPAIFSIACVASRRYRHFGNLLFCRNSPLDFASILHQFLLCPSFCISNN